jgi:hypothetical protein
MGEVKHPDSAERARVHLSMERSSASFYRAFCVNGDNRCV